MAEFSLKIGGYTAHVTHLFESTKCYCEAYLTEDPPDFSISVSRQDLETEQAALLAEAKAEGLKPRVFPDPFLERSVIQRKMAQQLFCHDIVLFHGSTVAVDGQAYAFTASCGTGKSTHTRLWREVFGSRAIMVNDDKPFLKLTEEGVLACGSPWSGKHGLDSNVALPLKGICILQRGKENRIWPLSPEEALPMLEKQSAEPEAGDQLPRFRALVRRLSEAVPLWQMQCSKDHQAALTSYQAMSQIPK